VLLPFTGAASDRFGRRPAWFFSAITIFVFALPAFWVLLNSPVWMKMAALVVLGLLYAPQLGTISATFPALFPTHIRFAGFAISYNVATAIAGGPTPAINTALTNAWTVYFPALFMMASCVLGVVAVYFAPETAGASVRGTVIPDAKRQAAMGRRPAIATD
jgi:MFS transporter, MHS family, proline/betaine transporter